MKAGTPSISTGRGRRSRREEGGRSWTRCREAGCRSCGGPRSDPPGAGRDGGIAAPRRLAAGLGLVRCAVIAREWAYLVPGRAFCEARGLPAQMGDEEIPGFWYLRETRALRRWLDGLEAGVIDGAALRDWADACPQSPWNELLRQAIDEHALEQGGAETPVRHFLEWLAEWGQDARRRHRRLLLLTAHRAKGLEFDHVVVLDGGWDRAGRGEGPDEAPQACTTWPLTPPGKPSRSPASKAPMACRRRCAATLRPAPRAGRASTPGRGAGIHLRPAGPEGRRSRFCRPAGRPDASCHRRAVPRRPPADARGRAGRRQLLNPQGAGSAASPAASRPRPGHVCRSASVLAVTGWSREASPPEYRASLQCDRWEVIVPELVFDPAR